MGALAGALASCGLPVWAKLSPNVTDLVAIAGAALGSGAGGLTLVNTMMGLALDPVSGLARLGAGGAGCRGPALHPIAVRAVFDCRRAFPTAAIIGVGGVGSGYDAAELLSAGAGAVQVGTASFVDPRAPVRVLEELADWCATKGYRSVSQVVGLAQQREQAGPRRPGRAYGTGRGGLRLRARSVNLRTGRSHASSGGGQRARVSSAEPGLVRSLMANDGAVVRRAESISLPGTGAGAA